MKRWLLLIAFLLFALPASATSTIAFVNSANGTTSFTVPAHLPGDILIAYMFRNNSNTAPTLPAGWTQIAGGAGTGTASDLVACKVAVSTAETATGFTNATGGVLLIYRGTVYNASPNCASLTVGGSAAQQNAGSATISYDGFTLTDTGGTSWVIGCAGSVSATNVNQAPTGMTLRNAANSNAVACSDSNGTRTAWTTQTVGVNASAAWQSITLEIRACNTVACVKTISQGFGAATITTVATSPAITHTAGNKLIALIASISTLNNVTGVANTAGDTWALCAGSRQTSIKHTEIWETTSTPNGNASDVVTATYALGTGDRFIVVYEVPGLAATTACDTAAINNCVACTSVTSASFSPAASGNFQPFVVTAATGVTYTAGTGYVLGIDNTWGIQHKASAASGAQTAAMTVSGSTSLGMSVASFKTTASSGGAGQQVGGFLVGP